MVGTMTGQHVFGVVSLGWPTIEGMALEGTR